MKKILITLNPEKQELETGIFELIASGIKFSYEEDRIEINLNDQEKDERIIRIIAKLAASSAKRIEIQEEKSIPKRNQKKDLRETAENVKEIDDIAANSDNLDNFIKNVKTFISNKGIDKRIKPVCSRNFMKLIDIAVNIANDNKTISWSTIREYFGSDYKDGIRSSCCTAIAKAFEDCEQKVTALTVLKSVNENVKKYFLNTQKTEQNLGHKKDEQKEPKSEIKLTVSEKPKIQKQLAVSEEPKIQKEFATSEASEVQENLKKCLKERLDETLKKDDSLYVSVNKISRTMKFENSEEREFVRRFLTFAIRPKKIKQDKILDDIITKVSTEYGMTNFEAKVKLLQKFNEIPEEEINFNLNDFIIVIREVVEEINHNN